MTGFISISLKIQSPSVLPVDNNLYSPVYILSPYQTRCRFNLEKLSRQLSKTTLDVGGSSQ